MIDTGHLQFFVCGVLLYQEATVTYVTIISLQLLNYAIWPNKRPSAGRESVLYRTLRAKILMELFKKFSAP